MAIEGDSFAGGVTMVLVAARRLGAALRVALRGAVAVGSAAAFGAAALRALLRVAGRRAGRRAVADVAGRDDAERASCCTCLVNASRRFIAFSRSTWLAVRSSRLRNSLTALSTAFCPSLMPWSICLRTSGGMRR